MTVVTCIFKSIVPVSSFLILSGPIYGACAVAVCTDRHVEINKGVTYVVECDSWLVKCLCLELNLQVIEFG